MKSSPFQVCEDLTPKPPNLSQCLQCLPYQSLPHPSTGPLSCIRWQVYKMARKLEFLVQWHLTVPFSPTEITSVRQSALFTASIYLKSCSNTWQCRTPPQCSSSWPRALAHLSRKVAIWAATWMNVSFNCWTWSPGSWRLSSRVMRSSVQVQNYYSFAHFPEIIFQKIFFSMKDGCSEILRWRLSVMILNFKSKYTSLNE